MTSGGQLDHPASSSPPLAPNRTPLLSLVSPQALKVGTVNYKVMAHLSEGHIAELGQPEPTEVSQVPVPGKAILVTGHDMHDLVR